MRYNNKSAPRPRPEKISSADKIIAAALREFVEHGLAGARVDRIASKSGVNKAMIYYHFKSKEKLYQEIISRQFEQLGPFLEAQIEKSLEPEEFFTRLAVFYSHLFEQLHDFRPLLLRELASGGEQIKKALTDIMVEKGLNKRLRSIIDSGKRKGQFRMVDSRQAIISFISMNLIYFIMAPVLGSIWEIKDERKFLRKRSKEVVDLFLYGLKVR
jgi:AcrR family transcriptional regulator